MANFSNEIINQVWEKAFIVAEYDKDVYRKDNCGAWIQRNKYSLEENLGWEIDHVYPSSKGGNDGLINLRSIQWKNNRSKADNYPSYSCAIKSNDNKNVKSDETRTIYIELQEALNSKYKTN